MIAGFFALTPPSKRAQHLNFTRFLIEGTLKIL